ncbi:MAG: hypothetical protein AAB759_02140 [Patescibacteria group bacterium]
MPGAFDITPQANLPFFDASNLWFGIAVIGVSILVSVIGWRTMRGLFDPELRARAILLWAIDVGLFVFGFVMITKAFPRISPAIIIGLFFLILLAAGGGTVAVKKGGEGAKDAAAKDKK